MNFDRFPVQYRDVLTDLPNRLAIKEALDKAISEMPERFALLEMDLDGFKEVNDTDGHNDGDKLLQTVAAVLADILREDDLYLPARKSGDEFSVILYGVISDEQLEAVRERIRTELDDYGIKVSIDGCIHKIDQTAEVLSHEADARMYQDKLRRKQELYGSPEKKAALREMGRIATMYGIAPRDFPMLHILLEQNLL